MQRSVWLFTLAVLAGMLAVLGALVLVTARGIRRLEPVHDHLGVLQQLESVSVLVHETLGDVLTGDEPPDPMRFRDLEEEISILAAEDGFLQDATRERLEHVGSLLDDARRGSQTATFEALEDSRDILLQETAAHYLLLDEIQGGARLELLIVGILAVVFPAVTAVVVFIFRRRIFMPLRRQVGVAARTLLEQQRELAQVERLAAMGEISAEVAHELRNPIAGIQVALSSLQPELREPEQAARVQLVLDELRRTSGLLDELLRTSRQVPEACVVLDVADTLTSLLDLAAYQLPEAVELQRDLPPGLRADLPEGRLRQSVLNLVLNSAQAIGRGPGWIRVRAARDEHWLSLSVCDNGPGFPDQLLDGGARPFRSWRHGGTGLGLATVQRFARDVGGRMELTRPPGGGSCALLRLPVERSDG